MSFWRILGLVISVGLIALAGFFATTPWRVHGGRFMAEYLALSGAITIVGLIMFVVSLRQGG